MNVRLGKISRLISPAWAACMRCHTTYNFVRWHDTGYGQQPIGLTGDGEKVYGRGILPLCEKCWGELTPEERLPYYRELWSRWTREKGEDWQYIEEAVLEGR